MDYEEQALRQGYWPLTPTGPHMDKSPTDLATTQPEIHRVVTQELSCDSNSRSNQKGETKCHQDLEN
jgi:hypothetical protein